MGGDGLVFWVVGGRKEEARGWIVVIGVNEWTATGSCRMLVLVRCEKSLCSETGRRMGNNVTGRSVSRYCQGSSHQLIDGLIGLNKHSTIKNESYNTR